MAVAKRTRLQRSLRENERNKRARVATRNKTKKTYGEDDSDGEVVEFLTEAEYLKRVFADSSDKNVNDSVQFVEEQLNPLVAGVNCEDVEKQPDFNPEPEPENEKKNENVNDFGPEPELEHEKENKNVNEPEPEHEKENVKLGPEPKNGPGPEHKNEREPSPRPRLRLRLRVPPNLSPKGGSPKEAINLPVENKNGSDPAHENEPEPEPEPRPRLRLRIPSNLSPKELGLGKRKGGSPKEAINSPVENKKRKKLKTHEAENIMLDVILEKGNAGLGSGNIRSVDTTQTSADMTETSASLLPLKFRFLDQKLMSVNSEMVEDEETESLFKELDFMLRMCDIGAETSFQDENDDVDFRTSTLQQDKLCQKGKHHLILDEEIGFRCKYCSFVKLEIRHVTPEFKENPFGRAKYTNYIPSDTPNTFDSSRLPNFTNDSQNPNSSTLQGTVWDLIPGIKETLYPHQQEGFEFIWKNVGGGINLNQLNNPTKFGAGGCVICHAPGTGKTCLAITFLQSFIRKYPMSKPVIIAPKSILLTWEEEFLRWKIDVPFINMNKTELSGNEDVDIFEHSVNCKAQSSVRVAKLYIWAKGKGILGISYTLFEKLAGDKEGVDKKIREALLKLPGILVLDEGHTARNDQSNIWNVLSEVETKRKIILSGTPFQNNFEELLNTFSLVREEFEHFYDRRRGLMGSNVKNDKRIAKLKTGMKPFVHVHKGEILKKTLRGLFHSVILLKPSGLQKTCFQQLNRLQNGLKSDHLVSIASIHPYLLYTCNEIPAEIKPSLKNHRKNLDAGSKIRFLLDLIKLSRGEKVLIFSQFLKPLKYIGNLLKLLYNWSKDTEFLYMDGKQDVKQRQAFIRYFNNPESEARVLLASIKACYEGIHLVGASRVVLLDVVWNPSVERQAISRSFRIGQKKDVFVYHLIMAGTREEDKYYCQVAKDRVSEKMFSEEGKIKGGGVGSKVSEDRVLDAMISNEKIKNMFVKIVNQPKADEFIDSFDVVNV